jgi:Uma2 family endonuclease
VVVTAEAGFLIEKNPDTVRSPDVAFIRAERMPQEGVAKYFPGAPDLAVEVISPSDRPTDISSKTIDWLRTGCLVVWHLDHPTKNVSIHRANMDVRVLTENDMLDCP